MDSLIKQPFEQFTVSVDFSAVLVSGESIHSPAVAVTTSTGEDVTSSIVAAGSVAVVGETQAVAMINGGDPSPRPYKMTVRCETSIGHRWEHEVRLIVRES